MNTPDLSTLQRFKEIAVEAAVVQLQNGMVVGLGSGTTATLAVAAIGRRIADGLKIVGIATSEKTADQARLLQIPLTTLEECFEVDVTIDGADEVETGTLNLVKGGGGNLLREKIVAIASSRMIVVVDETKVVSHIGSRSQIPVEVVPFGWKTTARRLEQIGATPTLRLHPDGSILLTDGGHYILDCGFQGIVNAENLQTDLDSTVGVVEHGLFIAIASQAVVGSASGLTILVPDKQPG